MVADRTCRVNDHGGALSTRIKKMEREAALKRIGRLLSTVLMLVFCAGSLLLGMSHKTRELEHRYVDYLAQPRLNLLSQELMSYRNTYELFVCAFLGNTPNQLLMGGYYYTGSEFQIYPDVEGEKTLLLFEGEEIELSDFLADQINARGNTVLYREPFKREILSYNVLTRERNVLGIGGVGQFVVCGDEYYYIDLSLASLLRYHSETNECETLVEKDVVAFTIAGSHIIMLDKTHTLYSYSLITHKKEVLAEGITAFSYNGSLWLQNNRELYRQKLGSRKSERVELPMPCYRLLGTTDSIIYYESESEVYAYDLTDKVNQKLGSGVFLSTDGSNCLWYSKR